MIVRSSLVQFALVACIIAAVLLSAYVFAPTARVLPVDPVTVDLSPLDRVPSENWANLRTKRIYFGHQSVGSNIIAGLEEILRRKPAIGMNVVSATDVGAFDQPGLIHGPIGSNGNIQSKLNDFATVVRGPRGAKLDIAIMKFCYADATESSDPAAILNEYESTASAIAKARPQVRLLHATMPLTSIPSGWKARVKRIIGRRPEVDNVVRGVYNDGLRRRFTSEEIFDIAAIESNGEHASSRWVEQGGKKWPTLSPSLTSDGGHLNEAGQIIVAREFLLLLAEQASVPAPAR